MAGPPTFCAATMKYSIGIENMVLKRLVIMAVRAAAFFASASASTRPRAIFWFGQMMCQTLKAMTMPSHMPIPI